MTDAVRCKFQCHGSEGVPNANADYGECAVSFGAVWEGTTEKQQASENAIFGKWTPSGSIHLRLANPAAVEFFEYGKKYYVTFTRAPD
jgi:hypothetical protein